MKKNRKYPISVFSQILLVLLAVFYVSTFAVEILHDHDHTEQCSSDDLNDGLDAGDCKICAFFAHHERQEITESVAISFVLFTVQERALTTREFTRRYQTDIQYFVNRGPPYLLV